MHFGVRPLVCRSPVSPWFVFLGSILPIVVGSRIMLRRKHFSAGEEEDHFVGDFAAGAPRLLLCILEHIDIIGYPLYFKVVVLHFIVQCQKFNFITTHAPPLGGWQATHLSRRPYILSPGLEVPVPMCLRRQ